MENGCMIRLRLRKLIDSKCDKLALNFSQKVIRAIRCSTDDQMLRQTVSFSQYQDLQETFLSLLYKFKKLDELKRELQSMDDNSAYDFLRHSLDSETTQNRMTEENPLPLDAQIPNKKSNGSRLLKYLSKVNQIALQLYVIRLLVMDDFQKSGHVDKFNYFLCLWLRQHKDEPTFREIFQKLMKNAKSRSGLYCACDVLHSEVSGCAVVRW